MTWRVGPFDKAKFCASFLSPSLSFPLSLQSNDNDERLQVVKLLAKMFGAKDSELASQNKPLWQCYLGRWVSAFVAMASTDPWEIWKLLKIQIFYTFERG